MSKRYARLVTLALAALFAQSCTREQVEPRLAGQPIAYGNTMAWRVGEHLLLGNPSNATPNTANHTNYLMEKGQFALSYNRDLGKPNWVSWHLDPSWFGATSRSDTYAADQTLPTGWYRVTTNSYNGSGFDRGHDCPSADRTFNRPDNKATFLMTNMMPQAPANNQQTWNNLEQYCRTLVDAGNELYVVCGSYGTGGTGSNGYKTTIDNGRVTVPANIWKVIVVLPQGFDDIKRITASTRVIAVNTPNNNSLSSAWATYRTTVDAIEAATGYDLLSSLPPSLQATLEAQADNGPARPRP